MGASRRADFSRERLRLARSFHGWTQAELGERIGVTHQYVGYLETGHKTPTELNIEAIADETGFEPAFFYGAALDEFRDEECHFRRRTTTPVSIRTRVLAHGSLFGALVAYIDDVLALPPDRVPFVRARTPEEIEQAAERCRADWGLGRDVPVKNLTRAIERAGVVVTRFEGAAEKIDAFSRAGNRSIIILNTDKDAPSRTRFDLAHECGHLVMHGGRTTGDIDTEKEADRFASALLLPRAGFAREFPRGERFDWPAMARLKIRWGVSLAAMIRRAYDLRLIGAAPYRRGYKYLAAQGWLRGEPHEPEPEQPELVALSLAQMEKHYKAGPAVVCARLQWRARVFKRVTGISLPEDIVLSEQPAPVVQLSLIRAERRRRSK